MMRFPVSADRSARTTPRTGSPAAWGGRPAPTIHKRRSADTPAVADRAHTNLDSALEAAAQPDPTILDVVLAGMDRMHRQCHPRTLYQPFPPGEDLLHNPSHPLMMHPNADPSNATMPVLIPDPRNPGKKIWDRSGGRTSSGAPPVVDCCSNPQCRSRLTYEDRHSGFLVCSVCNTAPNIPAIAFGEAERRTFEDGPDHRRTEENPDSILSSVAAPAPQTLGYGLSAAQIAAAVAAADAQAAAREEAAKLKPTLLKLPGIVEALMGGGRVTRDTISALRSSIEAYVPNSLQHRECSLGAACPHAYASRPDATVLVAALLRRAALRCTGGAPSLQTLADAASQLRGNRGETVKAKDVRDALFYAQPLVHSCRPCSMPEEELKAAMQDPEAPFGHLSSVAGRKDRITTIFNAVDLPPRVQMAAHQLAVAWSDAGVAGVKNGTFAAAALAEAQRVTGIGSVGIPTLAEAGGIQPPTVERAIASFKASVGEAENLVHL